MYSWQNTVINFNTDICGSVSDTCPKTLQQVSLLAVNQPHNISNAVLAISNDTTLCIDFPCTNTLVLSANNLISTLWQTFWMSLIYIKLEMWANAQRDGRPVEHRWRPVQRRKVWLTPTTRCRAVTLPRRETSWNLQGCPKLVNRSQPLVGQSSPSGHVEEILLLNNFFPIVDMCLSSEDITRQSCAMVPRWRFLATFLRPVFQRAACSTFQTCILNSH